MDNERIFDFVRNEAHRLGVDSAAYGVNNDIVQGLGELIFTYKSEKWTIFIEERGKKFDYAYFDNARDAIKFFFMSLIVDHKNRKMPDINFRDFPK